MHIRPTNAVTQLINIGRVHHVTCLSESH